MIIALLALIPITGVTLWAFFRYAPVGGQRPAIHRYNVWVVVAAIGLAATWSWRTYLVMSASEDAAWWPIISLLGSLVILPVVFGVATVVRNRLLFRHGIRRPEE